MPKRKILVCGVHYPFTMMSYFLRALDRREDVELKTLGAFTDDWIPWNGGLRIPRKYVRQVDFPLPQGVMTPRWEMVKGLLKGWQPDLVLQIDAGWHFTTRPEYLTATVATDPHVLDYSIPRSYSDYFFCMQKVYAKPTDIYLPYAADPTCHYPEPIWHDFDACLIGLHYPQRDKLVHTLNLHGVKTWYSIGEIYDEARHLYNRAKIALNWSSLDDLNARFFEGMAYNKLVLSNKVTDCDLLFEDGVHYVSFKDENDAVEKAKYYLSNPDKMREISENGYNEVVKKHTWDHRIQQIFDTVGL